MRLSLINSFLSGDTSFAGSLAYSAPEVFPQSRTEYSCLADIWSLGATLFHLMAGVTPYHPPGRDAVLNIDAIYEALSSPFDKTPLVNHDFSQSAIDFLGRMLCSQAERLSAEDCQKDNWILCDDLPDTAPPSPRGLDYASTDDDSADTSAQNVTLHLPPQHAR